MNDYSSPKTTKIKGIKASERIDGLQGTAWRKHRTARTTLNPAPQS